MKLEKAAEKLHADGWVVEPHGHGFKCESADGEKKGFLYHDERTVRIMFMPEGGITSTPVAFEEMYL